MLNSVRREQTDNNRNNEDYYLCRLGFDQPERRRIAGTTKRLKQTIQLTGFPGKPNARTVLDGFDVSCVVISANVNGFPGFIWIYM
jgi:hypothetical protein